MANIEVEFIAKISKDKYNELHDFLSKNCEKDLGEDNKNTKFYILPEKLFKVVDETSKGKGKLVLKSSRVGHGSDAEEIEIGIDSNDYNKAKEMFDDLELPGKSMEARQQRHNYVYKGVEIAVKYSEEWKYHIEMEIVIDDISKKEEAEDKIKQVADELEIKFLSEEEIKEITNAVESKL